MSDQYFQQQAAQPMQGMPVAATWGSRAGAYLIDAGVIVGAFLALFIVIAVANAISSVLGAILGILGYLGLAAGGIGYFIVFESAAKGGQTIGKKVCNIRVVQQDTGQLLTTGESAIRYVCRAVCSFVPLGLDLLWPLWDERKQALHDKLAKTLVVVA